jgi:predicted nucleotide-binding protein
VPYHVRITHGHDYTLALDKDAAWIDRVIAEPRRRGEPIFVSGRTFRWQDIDEIRIAETDQASAQLVPQINAERRNWDVIAIELSDEWYVVERGHDVTEQFITRPPGQAPQTVDATTFAANHKAVMVIYGQDEEAKAALFDWLRAIGLQPREWNQLVHASSSGSPYIGQVLDQAFNDAQAVIALFTPDEYARSRTAPVSDSGGWRLQARPNVLLEAGMALATHPTRTVIVVLGRADIPSDLSGRHYVHLSQTSAAPLRDLALRLRNAGCDTDETGTDWLDPGRFPDRQTVGSSPSASLGATARPAPGQTEPESPSPSTTLSAEPSTVGGDGVYLVGLDIQPGTYRTAGPADEHGTCYYALLSSTDTNDIISNNLVKGPATITIRPDVKAVHFTGCQPWHRLET